MILNVEVETTRVRLFTYKDRYIEMHYRRVIIYLTSQTCFDHKNTYTMAKNIMNGVRHTRIILSQ